jgi:acetyltransferase
MESVGDAGSFLSAARETALRKPVIVLKAGRTEAAARAAASHTGSLVGSDEVLNAAFRRGGVLRVNSIADVFNLTEALSRQPRPRGPRLTIVTNAGGPGVLATDALLSAGGQLATLSEQTVAALHGLLPPGWSRGNPVDLLGDADPERYARAVEAVAGDPESDGLLVVLTPQAVTEPTQTAERLRRFASGTGKPVLASWMGAATVQAGIDILNGAGIPTFSYPDTAARVFHSMYCYSYNLRGLYETPTLAGDDVEAGDLAVSGAIVAAARRAGRELLTELESKRLLAAYGIPTVETRLALGEAEAVRQAEAVGYPVVLKLHSETITHKSDVGGVQLSLADAAAVRQAYRAIEAAVHDQAGPGHFAGVTVQPMVRTDGYEVILGGSIDPQFGPVLLFGAGGRLVEVFRDRALALPPLNTTLARRMMEQTRVYSALKGVRGRPAVDLTELERLLVRFSRVVVEQRWVREIDVNPLLVSADRLLALDARVVLHGPDTREDQLPRLAVRPYPAQYAAGWTSRDGDAVVVRPIRPEDEPLLARFHQTLSEHSVYLRYLHAMKLSQRVAHERLARLCFIDYDREMALVAVRQDANTGEQELLGVGRLIKAHGTAEAEYALVVSDAWQRKGLGTELLRRLLDVARAEGIRRVTGEVLPDNGGMQRVCERLGFRLKYSLSDQLVRAAIDL